MAPGTQAVLAWGMEPGDGSQALIFPLRSCLSPEPVLLNALLGFFCQLS